MITVLVGLFQGHPGKVTKPRLYTPEWVNRLSYALESNLRQDFRLICLTSPSIDHREFRLEVLSAPLLWPTGDWSCLTEVFRPELNTQLNIFMGLDTIIRRPIDKLATYTGDFAWLRNPLDRDLHDCNAVVMWNGKTGARIWRKFSEERDRLLSLEEIKVGYPKFPDGRRIMLDTDYDAPSEMLLWSVIIKELGIRPDYLDDIYPKLCVSYNVEFGHRRRVEESDHARSSIFYFWGSSRPNSPSVPDWLKESW